jgi:hypothetical protein
MMSSDSHPNGLPTPSPPLRFTELRTLLALFLLLTCPLPGNCLAPTRGPGQGRGEPRQAREPRAEGVGCQEVGQDGILGSDYTGMASTTWEGLTCQVWSATTPHQPLLIEAAEGDHNYCRN